MFGKTVSHLCPVPSPVPMPLLILVVYVPLDYIGCYRDDKEKGRDLPFRPQSRTHNRGDALSCVLNCAESGFLYAGLQNGNLCFCGNKYGRFGRVSDKHCNLKCLKPIGVQRQSKTDDVFKSCGGKWVNSIYSGTDVHSEVYISIYYLHRKIAHFMLVQ